MKAWASAKLNLTLDIVGRRPDGYHLLDSLFHSIGLCDELDIELMQDQIRVDCEPRLDHNIARKAAQVFFKTSGVAPGCHIRIQKRIPVQSGLGGGSADAAAVLAELNELCGRPLHDDQLEWIGASLGADVPFALRQGHCRARGIGELLEPVPLPSSLHFVVAKPVQGLSTAEVFRQIDWQAVENRPDTAGAAEALAQGDLRAFAACAGNVLQPQAQKLCPPIEGLCRALRDQGAVYAAMTGSGSAVFGLFAEQDAACRAARQLAGRTPFVQYVQSWRQGMDTCRAAPAAQNHKGAAE